jgi:hypothetical protein
MASHPRDVQPSDMLCHKRKYLMLSILIQGPKQAGTDIDVFLEPLMEDMTKLWNEGGVCGTSISMSISHCMQSYLFVFMMLLGDLHYQGQLKGRVAHVLFA